MSTIAMEVDAAALRQNALKKINGQNHVVFKDPTTGSLYLQHLLPFETDQDYKAVHRALTDIRRMTRTNILRVASVVVEDRRMTCSSSSFKIYTEYFDRNLEDIVTNRLVGEYFPFESRYWRLLFSLSDILAFFWDNGVECNMVHSRAVYYNPSSETFGLIHPVLFRENNFTEALAGSRHFCSPELYYQILSRNKRFMLMEGDKSNSFSLGVLVLWTIHAAAGFSLDEVYNKEVISVSVPRLKQLVQDLRPKGFSQLFLQVLFDLTSEFEHVRLSPKTLLTSLGPHRQRLEADNFHEQDGLLEEYHKRTNLSENYELNGKMSHAFGFDGHDSFNVSSHVNSDEVVRNLKGKAQPFSNKPLNQDASF